MLAVLLLILKIIGIVLLSIIGLLLLIICALLFVPVRYFAKAYKNDDEKDNYSVCAKVTWFLHLVNVRFILPADEKLRVRITVFKVFPRKEKNSPIENAPQIEDNHIDTDNDDKEPDVEPENEPETTQTIGVEGHLETEAEPEEPVNEDFPHEDQNGSQKDKKKKNKISLKDRFTGFLDGIKKRIDETRIKYEDIKNNIDGYIDIYNSNEFQSSFALCKKKLLSVLKSILPRKIKGNVTFGKEDAPDTVGMVYSLYSVLYPKIGKNLVLTPDFTRDTLCADVVIKGKIRLCVVIFAAVRIYFDKNVKKLLKMLKKEKSNGR